jgi:tRNA pseudouridine synthase 10
LETSLEGLVVVPAALVAADHQNTLVQLKQYRLCKRCLARHTEDSHIQSDMECYICHGLMDDLDMLIDKMMLAVRDYEFNTFLIGASLPTRMYEREDAIRARLKIRGKENIKSQLTRELGLKIATVTKRKVDYMKPDITISLTVDKENSVDVVVKSRPIVLIGRYVKKLRGITQKQNRCLQCEGKGCGSCGHSGLSDYGSIEGIIAKRLIAKTKCETPRFSWIGSEDHNSLVLASGRPFSVRLYNPKIRDVDKVKIKANGVTATMSVFKDNIELPSRFIVKTRIYARCENAIAKQDLKKLDSLTGTVVKFKNRSKMATKNIYSATARQLSCSNEFILTMVADGGLMIKQFVGGEEYMKPNVSEILNTKCECITFDVLDVNLV